MEATTCNCNDRGFVHIKTYAGVTTIIPCDCRPAEYFAERSRRRWEEFEIRLEMAIKAVEHVKESENAGS